MGKKLSEIEAAIKLKMSPALLRWFTENAPKFDIPRKLGLTKQAASISTMKKN
jgi:hypothetical protein